MSLVDLIWGASLVLFGLLMSSLVLLHDCETEGEHTLFFVAEKIRCEVQP